MEKGIVKFDVPELQAIEKSKAEAIRATFEPMVEMLKNFEQAYDQIVLESKKEITESICNSARRLRIDIAKVRIQTGKLKDDGKAEYLRAERAIQAVHNIIVWAVTDKEEKLKGIENYFEIKEKERLNQLQSERAEKLSRYVEDADERDLSGMDADVWQAYYNTKKQEYEDRIAAEKKAEQDRIAKEKAEAKERERIRQENIRLQKEAEEREKAEKVRQEKEAAERKIREEKERKEREAFEAKLKKEREERQKVEAEIRAKREAEEKEKQRIADEKRKAELSPDKDKLIDFAMRLEKIEIPKVDSKEADQILTSAISSIVHTATTIRKLVNENLK